MRKLGLGSLLACVFVLAGCALGDSGSGSEEITREQLAVMVLPDDEFGIELAGVEVDPEDSGRVSAREAADATVDPNDTAAALRRAGWVNGYELNYSDPKRAVSFRRGEGLIVAGSTVDLFDTETSARAHLLDEIGEFERLRGKSVEGVRLVKFETFDVGVGDEGWGVEFTARAGRVTMYITGVVFRKGRLVADAGLMRADDEPMRAEAMSAALALESRIERVLAGDLHAEPVPLPAEKQPLARPAQLAKMTLALEDLPSGARLVQQGRGNRGRNFVSYYRTFDVENTMIGSSHLMFVRAQTNVFDSVAAAESMLRQISTPKGRAEFARGVLLGFQRQTGARPSNVDVRALLRPGQDATGVVVTFNLPGGRYRTATVVVRSGRSVAIVSGFCRAEGVNPDDMRPLAASVRARLSV